MGAQPRHQGAGTRPCPIALRPWHRHAARRGLDRIERPAHLRPRADRAQIGATFTYDSSRTPVPGEDGRFVPAALPPIDIAALKGRIERATEEREQADPVALRARIARLQAELAAKVAAPQRVEVRVEIPVPVEIPAVSEDQEGRLREMIENLAGVGKDISGLAAHLRLSLDMLVGQRAPAVPPAAASNDVVKAEIQRLVKRAQTPTPPPAPLRTGSADERPVSGTQRRILEGIAYLNGLGIATPSRVQVGWNVGKSVNTKSFMNDLGALRGGGWIEYVRGVGLNLTATGLKATSAEDYLTPTNDLRQRSWLEYVSAPQRQILELLITAYPDYLSREELGVKVGKSVNTKSYMNDLGVLRNYGLVSYIRAVGVEATALLFPEGMK
jgi:hypothetical protein